MRNKSSIVWAVVICLSGVGVAAAQNQSGQVDVTPFVGVYIPLADVVKAGAVLPSSPAASHQIDLMAGGKLTYWFLDAMGVEVEAMYAPNALESDAFGVPGAVDADFLAISLRLVYDFGNDPMKPSVLLTGGMGLFATSYGSPLDMTTGGMGLVGLGLRIPFGTAVALRFDVSDYLTTTEWELNVGKTDQLLQNDIALTGGLTFSFGR